MPIYARNSLGSDMKVTANENYSYADMGRILSECVQNDMTLFNAVLLNDFKESTAIREGTMVSSELTAFREFSVKEAWGGLKKKLQKLWEKIKGVFRQVYAKLTVWLVRNGKAFVAMHRKTLLSKAGLDACKLPKVLVPQQAELDKPVKDLTREARTYIAGAASGKFGESDDATARTNEFLGKAISGATAENIGSKFKEWAFKEQTNTTWGSVKGSFGGVEGLFTTITAKSDAIKNLNKAEKEIYKSIKEVMKTIDDGAKKEGIAEAQSKAYKGASAGCSAYERAITLLTRATIQAVKTNVSQARMIVGKLVAYGPNKENAIYEEMAWLEGADDFATSEDIPAEEINADDVTSDPDVEINIDVDDDGNECSK